MLARWEAMIDIAEMPLPRTAREVRARQREALLVILAVAAGIVILSLVGWNL